LRLEIFRFISNTDELRILIKCKKFLLPCCQFPKLRILVFLLVITSTIPLFSNKLIANNEVKVGTGVVYYFQPLTTINFKILTRDDDLGYGFQLGLGTGNKKINQPVNIKSTDYYYSLNLNYLIEFGETIILIIGPQLLLSNTKISDNILQNDQTGLFVNGGIDFIPFSSSSFSFGIYFTSAFQDEGSYGLGISFMF